MRIPWVWLSIPRYYFAFYLFSAKICQISVWDIRDASKRVAVVKQKSKERVGAGSVAERGMLFTLLLQSPYGAPQGDDKGDDPTPPANSYSGDLIEKSETGFCLSSSVPRLLAGYEDGSVCCFDIRTFRLWIVLQYMLLLIVMWCGFVSCGVFPVSYRLYE